MRYTQSLSLNLALSILAIGYVNYSIRDEVRTLKCSPAISEIPTEE